MTCLTALVLIRRVEVGRDKRLGADFVTVGLLKRGKNGTQHIHDRIVSESAPLTAREARQRIEASHV